MEALGWLRLVRGFLLRGPKPNIYFTTVMVSLHPMSAESSARNWRKWILARNQSLRCPPGNMATFFWELACKYYCAI